MQKGIVVFKLGRGDHVQAFAFGFAHQVLHIGALVVLGNHLVGKAGQVRARGPVRVYLSSSTARSAAANSRYDFDLLKFT